MRNLIILAICLLLLFACSMQARTIENQTFTSSGASRDVAIIVNEDDLVIRNCTFNGYWRAIDQQGNNNGLAILGCKFTGSRDRAVSIAGRNVRIAFNEITNGRDGIFIEQSNNGPQEYLEITDNLIHDLNTFGSDYHVDAIQFGQTLLYGVKNVTIARNRVWNVPQQAWWLNPMVNSGPCLIENNLVYNTWTAGGSGISVLIGNMPGVNIRNNILLCGPRGSMTKYSDHWGDLTGNVIWNLDVDFAGVHGSPVIVDNESNNIIYGWTDMGTHKPGGGTKILASLNELKALFVNFDSGDFNFRPTTTTTTTSTTTTAASTSTTAATTSTTTTAAATTTTAAAQTYDFPLGKSVTITRDPNGAISITVK